MALVEYNSELIQGLIPFFQGRHEANFAWVKAIPAGLFLPSLRCFWPGNCLDPAGNCLDQSGNGATLTANGGIVSSAVAQKLFAAFDFDPAASQYLSRADGGAGDVTDFAGSFTLGGWFYFDPGSAGVDTGLLAKWTTAGNQRSYCLRKAATDYLTFEVSDDGTANPGHFYSQANNRKLSGGWYFLVARMDVVNGYALFDNYDSQLLKTSGSTNVVVFDSSADFTIGAYNGGAFLDGRGLLWFLCAEAVPDAILNAYYEQTRALFED